MSAPVAVSIPEFVTGEGLRSLLAEIAADPDGWRTHPQVDGLMAYVVKKFAPLCAANHRPACDAAAAAFRAMRAAGTLGAEDPWGVVTKAVTLEIRAEARAERDLLSVDKARRPSQIGTIEVARAGERDWLLDAGHVAGRDTGTGPNWPDWLEVAARFLTCCGWPDRLAWQTCELVMTQATCGLQWQQVRQQIRSDGVLPARLGMSRRGWRAVVRLLVGVDPHASQVDLGVIRAVVAGARLADLLADEALCDAAFGCRAGW